MMPAPPVPPSAPTPATPDTRGVAERLELMAMAVRKGEFDEAAAIGNSAHPPLAVPQSAIENVKLISQGPNSTVRAAWLSSFAPLEKEGKKKLAVAVKRVALRRPSDGAAFRAEVSALARVAAAATASGEEPGEQSRVSTLVGARALPPDFLILTPLCARGSVAAALQSSSLNESGNGSSSSSGNLLLRSWPGILRLAGDIAQGISAVHAAGLVHRDVKPENVLLDDEGRGVLCDLGVAIEAEDGENWNGEEEDRMEEDGNGDDDEAAAPPPPSTSSPNRKRSHAASNQPPAASDPHPRQPSGGHSRRHIVGTLEFLPPEVLRGHSKATTAADVYAFGVSANALATRTLPPFADCDKPSPACHTVLEFGYGRQELVAAVAGEGLRPRLARRSLPSSLSSSPGCRSSSSPSPSPSSLSLVPPPPRFLALIERCWHADPRERPSAADVARECREIEEEVRREEERLRREGEASLSSANGAKGRAQLLPRDDGGAAAALLDTVGLDSSDDEDEGGGGGGEGGGGGGGESAQPWPAPGWALEEEEEGGGEGGNDANEPSPSSPSSSYLPRVTAAAFEAIGRREAMEDAVMACSPLYPLPPPPPPEAGAAKRPDSRHQRPAHLFAVFDGHRGAGAARYAARSLRRHLRSVWESSKSPGEALSRAFVKLDARWRRREAAALALAADGDGTNGDGTNGGGTDGDGGDDLLGPDLEGLQRRQKRHCGAAATAALIWGDSLTVANVGDCRGLLAVLNGEEAGEEVSEEEEGAPPASDERRRRDRTRKLLAPSWRPLRLTRDHSADDPEERLRVQSEGGTLIPPAGGGGGGGGREAKEQRQQQEKGWRLGPVGLAVTRALGDADVPGCSPVPFVSCTKLTRSCVALILMTDGVTEAMEARRGDATSFELEAKRLKMRQRGDGEGGKLSPSELADEEIAALVADTVKEAGMAARRLVVEAVEHRQGRDNAAALVAYLSPVESLERVF